MAVTQPRLITSRQNSRLKELRAALQHPGKYGFIGLEGAHLVEEAVRSSLRLQTVFVEAGHEQMLHHLILSVSTEVLLIEADVLASALTTETPQPIAALAEAPRWDPAALFPPQTPALIIVAASLQDPGNLGTLIRSAEAFGATGVILLPGTTSPWNPKALRASAGSAFRIPVVPMLRDTLFGHITDREVRLLAAVPRSTDTRMPDLTGSVAILIGNEGAGLSEEWLHAADAQVAIPCPGQTESLNAAVAGSILLYEASRQRAMRA